MTRRRGRPPHNDLLTPAEWSTLNAVRHGLTNVQIAERRGISVDAVKYHVANIIGKLGVDNRRALKLWVGSHVSRPMFTEGQDMSEAMHFINIGQIARSVADTKAAEVWYRDVLGLEHLYTFGDLAFFDCGGTRLMLSQANGEPGDESILYLRVPDMNAAHERLTNNGVVFINAPHRIHQHADGSEEWMAFFNDPEGRPLALMAVTASTAD